jgi:hypothetical protein
VRRDEKRRCEISTIEKRNEHERSSETVFEECVKEAETIELYSQQGSSDKVYHLQLHSVEEKWSAMRNGERRGSALQSDTKVSSVAYVLGS